MPFYTIGYGGRAPAEFTSLLVQHGVRSIADVRIHPDRASMGSYVKARTPDKGIEKLLADQGIAYRSILELGNMFRDLDDWHRPYRALFRTRGRPAGRAPGRAAGAHLPHVRREARVGLPPTGDRRIPGENTRLDC